MRGVLKEEAEEIHWETGKKIYTFMQWEDIELPCDVIVPSCPLDDPGG